VAKLQESEANRSSPSNAEFNPLKAELNPICRLLALLGAHHILHVSRVRVKNERIYTASHPLCVRVMQSGSYSNSIHCFWSLRKRLAKPVTAGYTDQI